MVATYVKHTFNPTSKTLSKYFNLNLNCFPLSKNKSPMNRMAYHKLINQLGGKVNPQISGGFYHAEQLTKLFKKAPLQIKKFPNWAYATGPVIVIDVDLPKEGPINLGDISKNKLNEGLHLVSESDVAKGPLIGHYLFKNVDLEPPLQLVQTKDGPFKRYKLDNIISTYSRIAKSNCIDVKGWGGYCRIKENLPSSIKSYEDLPTLPKELEKIIRYHTTEKTTRRKHEYANYNEDDIRKALKKINSDMTRDVWRSRLASIKFFLGKKGIKLAYNWSKYSKTHHKFTHKLDKISFKKEWNTLEFNDMTPHRAAGYLKLNEGFYNNVYELAVDLHDKGFFDNYWIEENQDKNQCWRFENGLWNGPAKLYYEEAHVIARDKSNDLWYNEKQKKHSSAGKIQTGNEIIKYHFAINCIKDKDWMDQQPEYDEWLGLPNGNIIHVPTGEVKQSKIHDFSRFHTGVIPEYNKRSWQLIKRFLNSSIINKESLLFLLVCLAKALTGEIQQLRRIAVFLGPTGGGKSTFINLLNHTLGRYFYRLPADMIYESNNKSTQFRTDSYIQRTQGARVVAIPDQLGSGIPKLSRSNILKSLTGEEQLEARINNNMINIRRTFFPIIVLNNLPNNMDSADSERLRVISFPVTRSEWNRKIPERPDIELNQKLKEAAPTFLYKLLQLAVDYYQEPVPELPATIHELVESSSRKGSYEDCLVSHCRIGNSKDWTFRKDLQHLFTTYCSNHHKPSPTPQAINRCLAAHGVMIYKTSRRLNAKGEQDRFYTRIKITSWPDEDELSSFDEDVKETQQKVYKNNIYEFPTGARR